MLFLDLFQTAKLSLVRNAMRSFLTMLGLMIGIGAVIVMLSLGQGAQGLILNQVADLGSNLVFVEPSSGNPNSGPPDPFMEQTLTAKDADALRRSSFFEAVSPVLLTTMPVSAEEESVFAQIEGVRPDYLTIFPAALELGRFLDETDEETRAHVVILGSEIAEELFGDQNPLSRLIRIKQTSFRVIGVFAPQGSRFFQNLDDRLTIPFSTMQKEVLGVEYASYLAGIAKNGDVETAKEEATFLLRQVHGIENPAGLPERDDFFVSSQSDAEETIGVVGLGLTLLLSSIAAISLVVGGIGIMNMMLVSVTERTREIGLRRALGATRRDILSQFLLEAILLTLCGGILGLLGGILVSVLAGLLAQTVLDGWHIVIPPQAILLSLTVSSFIGILFGFYPAHRAARLDPIEALRYE